MTKPIAPGVGSFVVLSPLANAALSALPPLVLLAGLAAVTASLQQPLAAGNAVLAILVALVALVTPWLFRLRGLSWDPILGGAVWMLCALGVGVVARVEPDLVERQLLWLLLGWAVMVTTLLVPDLPQLLKRYKYTWLIVGLTLVVSTLFFGRDLNGFGIRRWLQFGPIVLQPSEALKLLLPVFLAGYLDERSDLLTATSYRWGPLRLPPLPYLLPMLGMVGITLLILIVQPDLGPALLLFGTFLGMIYIGTGRRSYLLSGLAFFALTGALAYSIGHIRTRFSLWLDPWADPQGLGYQSLQALSGMAFGGVVGSGPGYGYPTLIPAAHTDYPVAVVGEEWGLIGTFGVFLLYALLVSRMLSFAMRLSRDRYAQLLAAGISISLGLQAFIILGGALRVIPLTGITAPFLSYGGSSMVMSFAVLGLLLRLWTDRRNA